MWHLGVCGADNSICGGEDRNRKGKWGGRHISQMMSVGADGTTDAKKPLGTIWLLPPCEKFLVKLYFGKSADP